MWVIRSLVGLSPELPPSHPGPTLLPALALLHLPTPPPPSWPLLPYLLPGVLQQGWEEKLPEAGGASSSLGRCNSSPTWQH